MAGLRTWAWRTSYNKAASPTSKVNNFNFPKTMKIFSRSFCDRCKALRNRAMMRSSSTLLVSYREGFGGGGGGTKEKKKKKENGQENGKENGKERLGDDSTVLGGGGGLGFVVFGV